MIHEQILEDLGGKRFISKTGCNHFSFNQNSNFLKMRLPVNKTGAKFLKINRYSTGETEFIFTCKDRVEGEIVDRIVQVELLEKKDSSKLAEAFSKYTGLNL